MTLNGLLKLGIQNGILKKDFRRIYIGIVKDPPMSIDTPTDLKKLKKKLNRRKKL